MTRCQNQGQAGGNDNNAGNGPKPFHGCFFQDLTRQGPAAPGGKKNYLIEGMLSAVSEKATP